jgi:hypothetical protein
MKRPVNSRSRRGRTWIAYAVALIALLALTVSAFQNPSSQQSADQKQGVRKAGVQPKRPATRRTGDALKGRSAAKTATMMTGEGQSSGAASPVLATADFDLIGLAVTVDPATQTVPKNTPTAVLTGVQVPLGGDASNILAGINPNYRVRGELSGPSMTAPLMIEAAIGQPLRIPPLSVAGDHVIQNLRVVDIGAEGQPVVTAVTPDACGIKVIDNLLVSEVHVNELTYDQIIQSGINISDDSYKFFNFTLGIATTSTAQQINIPVAFPPVGAVDPRPIVGAAGISGPGISAPIPDVLPVMLEVEQVDGGPNEAPQLPGGGPVRIPGLIVFPGRIGLLHQFFEAIVIVSNGAPDGTPLIIHNLHAKINLPDNATPADTSDDPLRVAETQAGGRVKDLEIHGLGPDNKYGTSDDQLTFSPKQSGQATFLLEGLKEGLHTINFDLEGMLDGLPVGPVKVRGQVPGAVLVRDASFSVTFTHPGVVRAGQTYDLAMTLYNSGRSNINAAFANLGSNSVSGAELLSERQQQFPNTVAPGGSATVKWRLRANVTGAVTASYVKVGDGVSAGLALVTGVGDRNVPLSPDSLILPDSVQLLPPSLVEAARQLLGQAWSVANAPPGALPAGVLPIAKQTVVDRAVELGVAGLRVNFGEPVDISLDTLLRDWLGELQEQPDAGFADALKNTTAGYNFYDALGAELAHPLSAGQTATALHQSFANTESPRSPFVSALVTQSGGTPLFGARLVAPDGSRVGFGANADERFGEIPSGGAMRLVAPDANGGASSLGEMLLAAKPASGKWLLEITGWQSGSVDVSLLVQAGGRTYKQFVFNNLQLAQGERYRVAFTPNGSGVPALETFVGGAFQQTGTVAVLNATLTEPPPRLVGVIQVTPEVVDGGDKYGRLVGLLFSKPMGKTSVETVSRYKIEGGTLVNSNPPNQVGGPVNVTGSRLDLGDRFVFLSLDSPIGPYIRRDLSFSGVADAHGAALAASPTVSQIMPRVSPQGIPPGAYLTGRVLMADGTPVVNAPVLYFTQECPSPLALFPPPPKLLATKRTDAQGRYQFDYVRDGDCGPLMITVSNPTTLSQKTLSTPVAYDGQHMVLDMVFLARGNVQGVVTSNGQPLANAMVQVVPSLDVSGTKVTQTDALGHYLVKDIPVGNVSVLSVGTGSQSNASGLAAGNIDGPGLTATVNVALQNISGVVRGRVVKTDQTPSVGSLVVAYANIPGFHSQRIDGAITVGYDYTDRDGNFKISSLPVSDIKLEVTDYVTGIVVRQNTQLTTATPEVDNILMVLPGNGVVSGTVYDEVSNYIPYAVVTSAGRGVRADVLGNYTLPNLPAGTQTISASDPSTGQTGNAIAPIFLGQTTSGINITILRPATLTGHVYLDSGGMIKPLDKAWVSTNGYDKVQTDALGKYTIRNVAPNAPLTLRFVDTDRALGVNMQVIFNAGETLTRDVTLRSASLHGRVTQPDGVTGTIAQLSIVVPVPLQQEGMLFGLLDSSNPFSTQSAPNGNYSISGLNPGVYRVSTSDAFFPTTVSKGGTLVPNTDQQCDLSLVSTLAGKIQGRVFQPDGTTPTGAGVEVTIGGGSLADATVRTDENGHYEFAEVFSAGDYTLTAVDPANGNTNRVSISIQRNQDAIADIQLHGNGSLRVHVVDGAGNPMSNGSINLDGTSYPNAHRYVQLTPDQGGTVLFAGLPEGQYGISAAQGALGGRTSATIPNGSTVDVVIQLQATGSIKGTVFMPDGTTPIGLADVQLTVNGRTVGYTVSSDADDAAGSFSFLYVPTGEFTLDVFDNRTGRVGRSTGRVIIQGQSVITNVKLLPVGAVAGQVTANGAAVDHALVKINADGSGLRGTYLQATTDAEGRYRFTGIPVGRFHLDVSDAPGGQTGSVAGSVTGTVEPLPDTIADIVLEPSATLTGTVYDLGGTTPLPGASVTVYVGGRAFNTSTNSNGVYRIGFVPLGEIRVRAEAPTGYSRGEAALVTVTQPGSTVTSDVVLTGTGSVSGTALDNNGANLTTGTVTFTNDAWGTPLQIIAPVQSNGRFVINGAPAGNFTLQLTVPNRTGTGSASALVSANQNVEVPIRLEDAGAVTGTLKMPDGTSPAVGSDVMLTLTKTNGQSYNFYTHTSTQGVWRFDNLPLGTLSVSITDANTGGIARRYGLALTTNGQVLDLGVMLLDTVPISIASVSPADGATNISTTAPQIGVTFSEPADPNTVNTSSLQLLSGNSNVNTSVTLSADKLSATITPAGRLAQQTAYTIVVNGIQDLEGLPLLNQFQSRFTTADETPPGVAAILPAGGATEVSLETKIDITFDEPLDRSQSLTDVIVLSDNTAPGVPLAGAFERDATGRIVTFRPGAALTDSSRYTVTVNGQRDPSGNVQTQAYTSVFTTHDSTAPVVDPLPIDGTSVRNYKPTITATYHDNVSGINTASVVLTLDNTNVTTHATVTGNQVTYTPQASLSGGSHTISVRVADNGGNLSAVRTATFTIDNSGPMISSFTIGGVPAADGLVVTSSLQPAFIVSYTDDTGINTAATSLLLGQSGSSLVPVPAIVTASGLNYQPPSNLTEGQYAVKAVITNNLGTSSTTGVINFTLNVNAPDIATITPNTGSQHGGMVATITGNRLLSTTGSAPAVSVGGNPAQVLSAVAGSPDQLTIMIPAGAPGAANVQAITDRGTGVRSGGFTYEADPRTPYTTEPDTVLLWHMDEPDNSTVQIKDSGATKALYGISSYTSTATAGRFAGGRALTNIQAVSDFGALYFGSSSFTTECWVKTNPVAMTYTLVGKEDFYGGYYGPPEYAIRLTPNGTLRAMVYDSSQRQWKAELSQANFNVTDNQWHQLAMVVDRTNSQLYLYVDGVERASSQMPSGFGAITNSGQPLRVGHYAPYDEQTYGGGAEFPGVIDEVRISASAHSAQRILSDVAGNAGLKITSYTGREVFRSKAGQTSLVNRISVNGYLLDGATARLQRDGQTLAAVATVQSSSYREAQIDVTVDPSVPLGFAQLIISKPGQAEVSADVIIEEQGSTPAALDTMLLWNLDEQNNGTERLRDAGPLSINGTASYYSTAVPGHFGGGRGYANAIADNDNGSLYFGSNSFTFGCWVKTGHVGMTYTIVGKEDFYGGYYGPPEFAVRLLPSGGLRAMVYDSSQRQWKAEVAPTTFVVDNNQWHYVAVSVDRTNSQLYLYVDGVERASSQMPSGFGALYNSGQQLRIGHYSPYDEQTTGGGAEFPGVIDDVLISSTAHSADRVRQDMERDPVLRVLSYDPGEFTRTPLNGQPQSAQMTLNGFGLDGVSAQLLRSGQPLNATATVVSSAYQQAQLSISVDPSVTPGNAQLVISKPSLPSVSLDVRITEQSEFAIDTDTRLLWHLNETDNGAIQLLDTGPLSINGRAGYYSTAQPGHFGGGRASADAIADADYGSLYFGSNGFTTECWVKTNPVGRTYTLVGKEDFYGGYYGPPEYAIRLTPAGALRALVYDSSQRQWKAEMPGRVYDPAQGRWQVTIDDGQWHHVSMVVDRAASQLYLYVDGVERASSAMPSGFGALYNSGQPLHVGHHSPYDEQTYGGGAEFPGVIDEVRISATAHSAARVFTDSLGTDTSHLATIQPKIIQKGSASVPVTFTGFGLSGATVTTDQPAVAVTVTSSSATTINSLVTVPSSVPIGQLHFNITEAHGQQLSSQLTVVDQQPFPNPSGGNTGTILLWHLDEPDNGRIPLIGAGDPVPSALGGATGYYSTAQTGRFGGGRASADAIADADNGALYFGSNNFTVECWFKTGVLGQTYTIVGKEDFYGGYYGPPEYAIRLSPNGTLRALVYDSSQRQWKAEASGTAVDPNTGQRRLAVNDGLWHHVSMVVDRTNNLLHLYADGVEQASEPMPSGFGALYNSGQPLHVGHYAPYDGQTYGGGAEFPGVIDEVRIVNYARIAAQMSDTWFGTHTGGNGGAAPNSSNGTANQQANDRAGQPVSSQSSVVAPQPSATQSSSTQATLMQLSAVNPREAVRDKASPQPHATLLRIEGEHLDKLAGAQLARDGKPLSEANAVVKQSDEHHAEILLSISPTLKLGPALLVLNRLGTADASIQIQVTEPGEFALETDTAGLWHLDEHENEATKLLDAGPNMINLTASRASKAVEGRFGGARSLAGATADLISDKLVFDNNGFTVEGWLRTEAVLRDYVIIGKSTNHGDNADFKLKLLRSGALRAEVYDTSGAAWQVEFPAGSSPVTDNQWHSVSMTLDGTARRLALYVDGQERASAIAPPAFASIRNLGQPLVLGCSDASDAAATGPEEFPGLLDEVRLSSTAHNAEKIATDYFGHDAPQLTLARPQKINKGAPSISLTLDGYGLGAVQVTTNHPEVLVNVNSSLPTRLELSLIVPEFVGGSSLQITATDPLGQAASIEVAMQGPSSLGGRNQRRGAPPNQAGYGALYRPQNSGRQGVSSRMLERQHAARNKD